MRESWHVWVGEESKLVIRDETVGKAMIQKDPVNVLFKQLTS